MFPPNTKTIVNADLHLKPGPNSLLSWREFEPLYNSVILSKLVLLDGDGLNELVRRAGVTTRLFEPGPATNILLGVVRSMTQSYQWTGEELNARDSAVGPTKHGICGPEHVDTLPHKAVCGLTRQGLGMALRTAAASKKPTKRPSSGGFVLWSHLEAQQKIFGVIFKGYGPGPGSSLPREVVTDIGPAGSGVRQGSRVLGAVAEQVERMRETLRIMQGKIGGVVTAAAPAAQTPPSRPPTTVRTPGRPPAGAATPAKPAPTAEVGRVGPITDWGQRCCAKDVAELRAALAAIRPLSSRLQDPGVLTALRRPRAGQIGARVASLSGAIDAFVSTRDAKSASAALADISSGVTALSTMVNRR
jgi:hypothetical protein